MFNRFFNFTLSLTSLVTSLVTFLVTFLMTSLPAHAADPKFHPATMPGQCYADVFSKRYLPEKETATQIYFTCNYFCFDNQNQKHVVAAVGSALKEVAARDGSAMVCDGAVVFERQPSLWDFSKVLPFWAFQTSRPEIQEWRRIQNVQIPQDELARMNTAFYEKLIQVGRGYEQAGLQSPAFRDAASEILEIASRSKAGQRLLAQRLNELAVRQTRPSVGANADSLVLNAILTHGRHLLP
ncbi:MAG: hypothetical protein NDI61_10660 [Bdellovibrionaceae bacterium]|nr:hypothetical protein [Pseudobdellovibrionaceae bacterium]